MTPRYRTLVSPKFIGALITTTSLFWAAYLFAYASGRAGVSTSSKGCSCHSSSPNANGAMTVSITGPQTVKAGSSGSYTISVSGGPSGTKGGFDLSASGGTFTPGTGTKVSSGDLVQSSGGSRSWSFDWQPPATPGTYKFYAVGMASNGSGSGGDSWTWYGDAVSTPFTIIVESSTPTLRTSLGQLKTRFSR